MEGHTVVVDRNGSPVALAPGAISFLVYMSIVASVKMNKSCPILIVDDFYNHGMDYSTNAKVIQCFREILDSQVILTSHSMHLHDFEVESHMIQLNR